MGGGGSTLPGSRDVVTKDKSGNREIGKSETGTDGPEGFLLDRRRQPEQIRGVYGCPWVTVGYRGCLQVSEDPQSNGRIAGRAGSKGERNDQR